MEDWQIILLVSVSYAACVIAAAIIVWADNRGLSSREKDTNWPSELKVVFFGFAPLAILIHIITKFCQNMALDKGDIEIRKEMDRLGREEIDKEKERKIRLATSRTHEW